MAKAGEADPAGVWQMINSRGDLDRLLPEAAAAAAVGETRPHELSQLRALLANVVNAYRIFVRQKDKAHSRQMLSLAAPVLPVCGVVARECVCACACVHARARVCACVRAHARMRLTKPTHDRHLSLIYLWCSFDLIFCFAAKTAKALVLMCSANCLIVWGR